MSAIAFDTLKFAKRLKEAGFTEQQAEALASAEADLIEANLATKRDLKDLELALRRDMKELEAKLTRDIEALGYRLTIRLGGMIAFAIGAVATLVKVL
jgi:hypothetical protein